MQLQTRMASHKKTTVGASARSHHSDGVYLVLGLTVMAHLEKSFRNLQHQISPLMNGTRLQTEQKGKGPAPLQGHDCCPALRSNAATSTNFVIVAHRNLQFCTLGMLRGFCHAQHLRNTHATRVLRDHAALHFTVLCARGM